MLKTVRDTNKYPNGVKPWTPPTAGEERSQTHTGCLQEDQVFKFTCPKNTTRLEALRLVHDHTLLWQEQIWMEYLTQRSQNLKAFATKECFDKSCLQALKELVDRKNQLVPALGSEKYTVDEMESSRQVDKHYKEAVDIIEWELRCKLEQQKKVDQQEKK